MPNPLIRVDPWVMTPPDRPFWTTPDMWNAERRHPTWSTGEMCKTFLVMNRHSVLWHVQRARGVEGLPDVAPPRRPGGIEAFQWRLYDIEVLAHHLATRGVRAVTPAQLRRTITMIRLCAEGYEYL